MRILVVSDTHGNEKALFSAEEQAGEVDLLIHLGDGEADTAMIESICNAKIIKVAGNCDIRSNAPRELLVKVHNKMLLLTHGDMYGVKAGLEKLVRHGSAAGANLILYGHTHKALTEKREELLLVNPGTLCHEAAFHSYAIITVSSESIETEIHELR